MAKRKTKRPPRDTGFERIKREARVYGIRAFAKLANMPHTTAYKALSQKTPDPISVGVYRVLVATASKLHTKRKVKRKVVRRSPKQTPNATTSSA